MLLLLLNPLFVSVYMSVWLSREENIDNGFRDRFPHYTVPPSSELSKDIRRNVQLMLQAHEVAKSNDQVRHL